MEGVSGRQLNEYVGLDSGEGERWVGVRDLGARSTERGLSHW